MKAKFLKKLLAALLLALLAALPAAAAEKRFHILMINDPHSYILPYREAVTDADGRQSVAYTGGMARALELVREERAKIEAESGAPVFLFEAGDVMLGLKGALTAGEAEYGALALLGFDAGVLGNHDFDGGVKTLAKLGPKLKFPVLASNIEFEDERAVGRYFAKSAIIERGGVKLGVFGLVTPELKSVVSFPEGFSVDTELAAVAERYVRELRAAGADAVVAINHIGLPPDKKLAAEARGIDVIVGGHTHDAVEEKIIIDNGANSTLVGQAGLDGRYAGRFDVTVDDGGLVAEKSSWTLLRVTPETRGVPEAEAMGRAAQREIAAALKISNPIMGLTRAVDCTRTAARTRENEFGNLAAEAFRYSANARIGFINGGSLRIGRVVPPGPFSSTDMLDLIPYGDKLRRLLMTGAQIREQLEISASSLVAPGEEYDYARRTHSGEFLHVAGLRFEIDLDGEAAEVVNRRMTRAGSRVRNVTVESAHGWEPLDDEAVYSVAASAFLCREFGCIKNEETPHSVIDAFDAYCGEALGRRFEPKLDGRIKITGGGK